MRYYRMTNRMSFMRLRYHLAARVTYGRNFLTVTDTVLAITAIANLPQYDYGRMTKNLMRSYTMFELAIAAPLQVTF